LWDEYPDRWGPDCGGTKNLSIKEFDQIFHCGMKDICDLDDINQVVDLENSSFYQASNLVSNSMN
tara:strand:- start:301 stop:495 length:195 start_codon:yes stop_codon:yes gene_type:complete